SPSLAWHPSSKEAQATLSSIQIGKGKALAIKAFFPAGAAGEIASDETSTKGWDHAAGVGLLLQPDGTSRYVDFALIDAGTGEAFKYGLSTRDPSCHQVFIPFALFNSGKSSFEAAKHLRVRLAFGCQKQLETPMTFKAALFSVGRLDDGEFAWPASTPPFVGTPVYLETFENAASCETSGMASFTLLMNGPPKTNIARSLSVRLASADAECLWTFPDIGRWNYFDGMTIWFKIESPTAKIELVVLAKNASGEKAFAHDIPAQGSGWVADHIEWDDFIDAQGHNFEPDEFSSAALAVRAPRGAALPLSAVIGPFRLDDE
ncbi:MAG: hypothetical protein JHC34_02070, partial [Acidobacteria bacterium]|nr:hypothetical protein [Acidobacteriota bacterium]